MTAHPQLPKTIEFSDLSYSGLSDAESAGMKGFAALTPYFNLNNLKHYQVIVNGYNETFLTLDTSHLFYGCENGQTELAYPLKTQSYGSAGGPVKAIPLSLRRIHFVAGQGKNRSSQPNEYYTYVLCGPPVLVNPASPFEDSVKSYANEEINGAVSEWGETSDPYASRLVIGGGYVGPVITDLQTFESGCLTYLKWKTGLGYLHQESTGFTISPLTYNSGSIKEAFCALVEQDDIFKDYLLEIINCACSSTGLSGVQEPDTFMSCLCNLDLMLLTGNDWGTGLPPPYPTNCVQC